MGAGGNDIQELTFMVCNLTVFCKVILINTGPGVKAMEKIILFTRVNQINETIIF